MTSTRTSRPDTDAATLMQQVSAAMARHGLSPSKAAALIGVGASTLQGHLRGEHVRSDSARKYGDWLAGRDRATRQVFHRVADQHPAFPPGGGDEPPPPVPRPPRRPHLVVDIFSGCGGLSLGFDLLGGGGHFRTVMALDFQPAAVAVMNANHPPAAGGAFVARVADMTEFINETEVLAFYMEHVVRLHGDGAARIRLESLAGGLFPRFLAGLAGIDARFVSDLAAARASSAYRLGLAALDKGCLLQTSVAGFHDSLKLPRTTLRGTDRPATLWSDVTPVLNSVRGSGAAPEALLCEARQTWDDGLVALEGKQISRGKGQLESSARRIQAFLRFARSEALAGVRDAWCRWSASRLRLRSETFSNHTFATGLRSLYEETYPVSVLLGGPPCQGFSRIGRGKIRSLREASVHVHGDDEAGDSRNQLYQRYLLVVSALRPLVFKFENVQHFQSTVKSGGRTFLASEVLAEAIEEMSEGEVAGGLSYAVASRTIDASRHGVPQTRQRFFMSGVRRDAFPQDHTAEDAAAGCLRLPEARDVPLSMALDDLPDPALVGGDIATGGAMAAAVWLPEGAPEHPGTASGRFRAWLRQPRADGSPASEVDGHVARTCRLDDAGLFALMGPGKRWMDYRVDDAPTVAAIGAVLRAVAELSPTALKGLFGGDHAAAGPPSREELKALAAAADGSLALRLLLEQVGERIGSPHHLLTEKYLAKRDGHHGDWVARLDGGRPCKTIVAHIAKDSYGYIHPGAPRTISVREAARVQTFPDWFSFGAVALTDAFRMIGNAVPPLLGVQIAARVASALALSVVHRPALQLAAE